MKKLIQISFIILMVSQMVSGQWAQTNGPNGGVISSLEVFNNFLVAGTTEGGIFYTSDEGNSWTAANSGLTDLGISALLADDSILYAGTSSGIFKSSDIGSDWIPIGPVNTAVSAISVMSDETNEDILIAGTDGWGIFRSTNNGMSWVQVNSLLCVKGLTNIKNASGENYLFAGTLYPGLYRSSDNGINWTWAGDSTMYHIFAITSYQNNSGINNIYAGAFYPGEGRPNTGLVFLSTNNGSDWNTITPLFGGIVSMYLFESNLFIYDDWGYLRLTTDNGVSWTEEMSGLTDQISSLKALNGFLFAGGENYVWKRPLHEMITSSDNNIYQIPKAFSLSQNYPNPFNPATTLLYKLAKPSFVSLKVYDVLGKETAVLVNEEKPAGKYTVSFDGSDLASGVYFYELRASGYVQVRKMVLLR